MKRRRKKIGCLPILGIIILLGFGSQFLGKKHSSINNKLELTTATTTPSTEEKTNVNSQFSPSDTSDATIESISTYSDYLTMYELIVSEYLTNFENIVNSAGFPQDDSYQLYRDQVKESVEQQKKQYGPLKNTPLVGKEDLVKFLKEYRDELKDYTDQMSQLIQTIPQ